NLVQLNNPDEIVVLIESILKAYPNEVEQYRTGKEKVFGFFVGKVMKESKGKANPQLVNEILKNKLNLIKHS
ncbi:MAG: Asp-tRNA(Asn)/Glu-tRNA(Gln) amidotransferase GatCAB subunit B, partial [Syntrophothermus sp.]